MQILVTPQQSDTGVQAIQNRIQSRKSVRQSVVPPIIQLEGRFGEELSPSLMKYTGIPEQTHIGRDTTQSRIFLLHKVDSGLGRASEKLWSAASEGNEFVIEVRGTKSYLGAAGRCAAKEVPRN